MQLQPVRGTKDILPDDYSVYLELIAKAKSVAETYGYRELAIPIFEFSEVFKRTLGDYSDVVTKEMYSFDDRGGQSITLRPEHTAGIARCVISNGLQHLLPLKLMTIGPNFRYERPQKGRMRQFHQMSVEAIGYSDPVVDAETIALGAHMLKALNILDKTKLEINTLGDAQSRDNYLEKLGQYLAKYRNELSEDSKIRLEKNPLRILDSKDANDQKIVADAPVIYDSLTIEAKRFFDSVLEYLTRTCVSFKINPKIVRGLDYYVHTAFEFVTDELGSQGTVLAGGRYDPLYKMLGGPDTPAVGFAMGLERVVELYMNANLVTALPRGVSVVSLDESCNLSALQAAQTLRYDGALVHLEQAGNVTKAIKKALAKSSRYIVIIGEDELRQGKFMVKNLDSREERMMGLEELVQLL